MKGFKINNRNLLLIIFGILLVVAIDFSQIYTSKKANSYPRITMDHNWTYSINGKESTNITLSELSFPNTNKGDVIVMSNILPNEHLDNPVINYSIYHSTIKVYVDDELIYEYGDYMRNHNYLIGNTFHSINLPDDYMGKKITFYIYVCEDTAFSSIDSITIMDETNNLYYHILNSFQNLLIAAVLFVFGIILMLTIIIKGSFNKELRKLFWIALMSTSFALWILSNLSFFGFVLRYKPVISFMEYFSLFLITPSGIMYFYDNFTDKKDKRLVRALALFTLLYLMTISIFHFLKIVHISYFLKYSHMITFVSIFIAILRSVKQKRHNLSSERLSNYAFLWLFIAGLIELIRFNILKYIVGNSTYKTLMPTSVLVFVVLMTISYLEYMKEYLADVAAKNVLTKLAYHDTLTGIANRARCDEELDTLRLNCEKDFSIIYFDLNNLKKLNDTKGHLAGDAYICDFAHLLKANFDDYGLIGRMGGDEFIVISRAYDSILIIKKIMNMIEESDRPNSDYETNKISFAYGYAVSTQDKPLTVDEAFAKADKHMYECKRKQKNNEFK